MFANKTLLITGGTGSFGNAVLSRFLDSEVKEIRVFSRDEKKQEDMRIKLNSSKVKFYIGDVRHYDSVSSAMTGVDYIFHAAALKQVPSCEFYPMEAVRTNILGTENVLNAALAASVEKVIVLSTDKAVYPINAMGLSKAMMEKLMIAKARTINGNGGGTILCGTRYGNVMATRGSVIPLFVSQIKANSPLTVTDPKMTRFLMSLDEAIDLVLHAFQHAAHGDIFVQKSPASTIYDLAVVLQEIFRSDSDIKIIGTRHGEKLYETLLTREELAKAEDHGSYYRIIPDDRDLNYNKYFTEGMEQVSVTEDYNSHNTTRLSLEEVKEKLMGLDYIQRELASWSGS
ncbi:MAG: polysaccharide biosynthesis protein [Syntrophales bacterium]|nr:polysaccharide biosynthesis protein [Syntrophales bacterium]